MNEENLKPLTTEKAREIGKIGGKKSVEVRRERKKLREDLIALLKGSRKEIDGGEGNVQQAMCLALIVKALGGDVNAFKEVRDTIGEKPIDNVVNNIVSQVNVTKNDIKEALNDINSLN